MNDQEREDTFERWVSDHRPLLHRTVRAFARPADAETGRCRDWQMQRLATQGGADPSPDSTLKYTTSLFSCRFFKLRTVLKNQMGLSRRPMGLPVSCTPVLRERCLDLPLSILRCG